MKTTRLRLILALWSVGSLGLPVSAQETLGEGLAAFPNCSLQCALPVLQASPCALTDEHCLCDDPGLQGTLWGCAFNTCSVADRLATKGAIARVCDITAQSRNWQVPAITIPMFALALVAVSIRLVVRSCSLRSGEAANSSWSISKPSLSLLDVGDLVVVLALCGLTVTVVTGCVPLGWQGQTARVPVGIDLWALSPDLLYMFGYWLLVWEILYFVTTSLIKMSLCLLFLRIFGQHSATARIPPCGVPFRAVAWATLATNAVVGVVFLVLCFTQCFPLSYSWTHWDGQSNGYCPVEPTRLSWSNAAFGIAMDAWMLFLPLSQIPKMNMGLWRKVGVTVMFCLGTLATVVSILRLFSIARSERTTNPTQDLLGLVLLSSVEMSMGIICACLPSLRIFLLCVFRGTRDTVSQSFGSQSLQNRQGTLGSHPGAGQRRIEQGQRTGAYRRPVSAVHYSISSSGIKASRRPVSLPASWRGDTISECTSGGTRAGRGGGAEGDTLAAKPSTEDVEPAVAVPTRPEAVMEEVIPNGKGGIESGAREGASGE